ncbi:MAG: DNA replication and repair protein RecF [Deltaproteobacteria bacterium]|nr:DNA replication and repair protein RecF [Deltaproteobacteria bacterium]
MLLKSLHLKNFRNYRDQSFTFHPHFNLIIGDNAQGKTNLLEAIYYLGYLNPFRPATKEEMILSGEAAGMIEATLSDEGFQSEVKIVLEPHSRKVSMNGKKPETRRIVPVLLFEPREVYLFRESPSVRRHFLDKALLLNSPEIYPAQKDYEEIIRQKNRLLKETEGGSLMDQLPVWNEKLVETGAHLIFQRLRWMEAINGELPAAYHRLLPGTENLIATYECRLPGISSLLDESEIRKILAAALEEKKGEEIRRRESAVGPHRDDWSCFLDGRGLGVQGSQGENRSAVIALKWAQVNLVQKKEGKPPIFLLDDVCSELDLGRKKSLLTTLAQTPGQVFLSTAEPGEITPYFNEKGSSFLIEDGRVRVIG